MSQKHQPPVDEMEAPALGETRQNIHHSSRDAAAVAHTSIFWSGSLSWLYSKYIWAYVHKFFEHFHIPRTWHRGGIQ